VYCSLAHIRTAGTFQHFFYLQETGILSNSFIQCIVLRDEGQWRWGDSGFYNIIPTLIQLCTFPGLNYTEWSKNLCAPDDYTIVIRYTETFWSSCSNTCTFPPATEHTFSLHTVMIHLPHHYVSCRYPNSSQKHEEGGHLLSIWS